MTDDTPSAKSQSIAGSVDEDEPPAESTDETLDCVSEPMTDNDALQTYNATLDRDGYFCHICGHEANGPGGLEQYEHVEKDSILNVCKSVCLQP